MLNETDSVPKSNTPGKAGSLVLLAPQRGKNMKRLKALTYTPNFRNVHVIT